MAGTVIADKVQAQSTSTLEIMNGVALTPPLIEDVNGVQVGTFCRAWVNFNGEGTVAIRASFNVSSITDNGTGDYTVNFTTALPDANYSASLSLSNKSSSNAAIMIGQLNCNPSNVIVPPTTTALRFTTWFYNAAATNDANYVNVSVFR
jgi:hypothetical protein